MNDVMSTASNAQLNAYAYQLLGSGQHDRAIEIFIMNTEKNGGDPNVWDSLGEGYMGRNAKGDKKKAIKAFKKVLSMNPMATLKANSLKNLKTLGQ